MIFITLKEVFHKLESKKFEKCSKLSESQNDFMTCLYFLYIDFIQLSLYIKFEKLFLTRWTTNGERANFDARGCIRAGQNLYE